MVVTKKFIIIDVRRRVLTGPSPGSISSGSIISATQNVPRGGIQAVLRICATVRVDFDKYSIHPLQNMVRARLTNGITTHPKRANRNCVRDGKNRARAKLQRVRITLCTMPNVMRRA